MVRIPADIDWCTPNKVLNCYTKKYKCKAKVLRTCVHGYDCKLEWSLTSVGGQKKKKKEMVCEIKHKYYNVLCCDPVCGP